MFTTPNLVTSQNFIDNCERYWTIPGQFSFDYFALDPDSASLSPVKHCNHNDGSGTMSSRPAPNLNEPPEANPTILEPGNRSASSAVAASVTDSRTLTFTISGWVGDLPTPGYLASTHRRVRTSAARSSRRCAGCR
ncbi:hypothetical protein Hypma_009865 [Hypsizygus marmoreus]|uniref:Uncharacterized protein n=1 Tax=Hypsizygus marmoreus TaxID=39966 RepID=A0A369JL44_HYPMA|nr:hypothetical protein Hypma_009865 [Hypsizygus marmoreus]